ncbi:MAG: nucleotide exchange factor GrpE [Novosphingobium sp. 35-62-5]|nr:MAG: nucleotide exchange factor GrpE [Novosphingobium sp. 35-62-5]
MSDNDTRPTDAEIEAELKGVPEDMIDQPSENDEAALLREQLETAKQDVLYAKAETQNVRRRMEKDIADARAYAATGFARDILSVADNLSRALETIPADLREDDKFKNLVAGLEATGREIEKVFGNHGITRIAAMGLPLDPHQHQAIQVVESDQPANTVVTVLQKGYRLNERTLRPALVMVAKGKDA